MTEDCRCPWCGEDPIYVAYHDDEWGVPERDSRALWENVILEGFQAGLSWITILKKRDAFREAFAGFDPEVIATWGEAKVEELLTNRGIVRHRGKIAGVIKSAQSYLRIEEGEGFANFIWKFQDGQVLTNEFSSISEVPAQTKTSEAISKALKANGFNFCGPTISYAFMQASGLVNDHLVSCPAHQRVARLAKVNS